MKRIGDVVNLPALAPRTPIVAAVVLPPAVQEARTTAEVERAILRSLPASVKAGIRQRSDFQTFEFIGFDLVNPIDPTAARDVLGWLDATSRRSGKVEMVQEITRCLSVTAARAKDQTDLKVMLAVMAEELSEFPADVVREALRTWAREEKWWPSLAEIRERCLKATRVQRSLKSVLKLALHKAEGFAA